MDIIGHIQRIKEILIEGLRLLLLFIGTVLFYILKYTIRGIIRLIRLCKKGYANLVIFWKSNDTQAKLRIMRRKLRHAWRRFKRWSVIAAKATWKFLIWSGKHLLAFLIWSGKTLIKALFHLRATSITLWRLTKKASIATAAWLKRRHRISKVKHHKRKKAYKAFHKTPGVKGLFTDVGNHLKQEIQNYLEEDQSELSDEEVEVGDNVVTDDELLAHLTEGDSKVQAIGKRIYSSVQGILDSPERKKQ